MVSREGAGLVHPALAEADFSQCLSEALLWHFPSLPLLSQVKLGGGGHPGTEMKTVMKE